MKLFLLLSLICVLYTATTEAAQHECEVCEKFLGRVYQKLKDEKIEKEPLIKARLKEECRAAKGRDNRFCYYIGGTDDAATGLIGEVSKPLSHHLPVEVICKKLKKKDSQICELKYEKQIDWKNVNLNKMRVKQLRKILADWGEDCIGCLEKRDFINRIKKLSPQHIHMEL